MRAKGQTYRHNEACRARIDKEMEKERDKIYKDAVAESTNRVSTNEKGASTSSSTKSSDFQKLEPPPASVKPQDWHDMFTNANALVNTVQASQDRLATIVENGRFDNDMTTVMNIIQTLGIEPENICNVASAVVRNSPGRPTFIDAYGRDKEVELSHTLRRHLNINGLAAFDKRTLRPDGQYWDFTRRSDRVLALKVVRGTKPTWIVGSHPCTMFSQLFRKFNRHRMDPVVRGEEVREAKRHLRCVCELYRLHRAERRRFIHEHLDTAASWVEHCIKSILSSPKVLTVNCDQCHLGLNAIGPDGSIGPPKKPIRFMTTST